MQQINKKKAKKNKLTMAQRFRAIYKPGSEHAERILAGESLFNIKKYFYMHFNGSCDIKDSLKLKNILTETLKTTKRQIASVACVGDTTECIASEDVCKKIVDYMSSINLHTDYTSVELLEENDKLKLTREIAERHSHLKNSPVISIQRFWRLLNKSGETNDKDLRQLLYKKHLL